MVGRAGRPGLQTAALPQNAAMEGIVAALAQAAQASAAPGGVVLMVVQPGEKNAYDQQASLTWHS